MTYTKDITVIIPHRDTPQYLPNLLASIPKSAKIEIIIVDNSTVPLQSGQIETDREFTLLHSDMARKGGGARNEGIVHAHGKWLVFADADDFFSADAFDAFYRHIDTNAELVFFTMKAVFRETGQPSVRTDRYVRLVDDYLSGATNEMFLRLYYSSPCAKMVSHAMVDRHGLRYDEGIAADDKYFCMQCGYHAQKVEADLQVVYIATVTHGSQTQTLNDTVMYTRLEVNLRCNQFLRSHGLAAYQFSILNFFLLTLKARPMLLPRLMCLLVRYRQNPLVGASRWIKTAKTYKMSKERA